MKALFGKLGFIDLILASMKIHSSYLKVVSNCLFALGNIGGAWGFVPGLSYMPAASETYSSVDACEAVVRVGVEHLHESSDFSQAVLVAIGGLAQSDANRNFFGEAGACALVFQIMTLYSDDMYA